MIRTRYDLTLRRFAGMADLRLAVLVLAAACGVAVSILPTQAQQCEDADPLRVTAQVSGDFEFTPDPDDPKQHLIFVSNVDNGRSSIVVARMDGITGRIDPGTLTTVATNFQGDRSANGPEFVHPPGLGLGVLYRALDGVHAVFRPRKKTSWNDFAFDVNGAPATLNPPVLSSSFMGSYETGGLPFGQNTYTLFDGPCTLRCFASMRSGVPTDVARVVQQTGNLVVPTIASLVQGPIDGTVYFEACSRSGPATCGLFEAAIDGSGGFAPNSFELLAALPRRVEHMSGPAPLAVEQHPVTGEDVIFIEAFHQRGQTVDVYERPSSGGLPALIASVPAEHTDHYRVIESPTEVVLNFLVRDGAQAGSYTLPVTATGKHLRVGAIKKIAAARDGAEVEYLPASAKFAIFYRLSRHPSLIERCFFEP